MIEQFRENYFLAVRMVTLLALEIYIVLSQSVLTGASGNKVLLLLALLVGAVAGKELVKEKKKWIFLCLSVVLCGIQVAVLGSEFLLVGIFLCYEIISFMNLSFFWYLVPLMPACIPNEIGIYMQLTIAVFIGMLYVQHDFIIESYRKQTKEDTISEQRLKRNMYEKEHELQEEINRGLLRAENQLLEERARLSQTLHDKLGHNINGSIYQLEAIKLLMEKDPETSKKMTQAVIDQLRTGMDEIRAILRKERPKKYKLALLQLQQLCEECNQKGVEAEFITEGEMADVPEKYLEIILDNAYEAVSNAMKYAKCTRIEMKIIVMNQVIRCSISDNGVGCVNIVDGMGLTGMRRRIREVNGILDFDANAGFSINMLLPR